MVGEHRRPVGFIDRQRAQGGSGGTALKGAAGSLTDHRRGIQDLASSLEGPGPVTSGRRVGRRLLAVTAGHAGLRRKIRRVAAWELHAGTARDTNKQQRETDVSRPRPPWPRPRPRRPRTRTEAARTLPRCTSALRPAPASAGPVTAEFRGSRGEHAACG